MFIFTREVAQIVGSKYVALRAALDYSAAHASSNEYQVVLVLDVPSFGTASPESTRHRSLQHELVISRLQSDSLPNVMSDVRRGIMRFSLAFCLWAKRPSVPTMIVKKLSTLILSGFHTTEMSQILPPCRKDRFREAASWTRSLKERWRTNDAAAAPPPRRRNKTHQISSRC